MPFYESVFIARQEISSQQFENLGDQFVEVIGDGGGKVTKRENWGLKGLAYRINKSRKAHYMLFNIDAPAEAILEMERQMRLSEDILRYITIKIPELNKNQAIKPSNGNIITNPIGSARGFQFENSEYHLFALPGVPSEMKAMMNESVLPWISSKSNNSSESILLRTTGIMESALFEKYSWCQRVPCRKQLSGQNN